MLKKPRKPPSQPMSQQIEKLADLNKVGQVSQDSDRILLHTQYELAYKRVIQEISAEHLDSLDTEDDLLKTAVSLTR
jgi:hypothetical protein